MWEKLKTGIESSIKKVGDKWNDSDELKENIGGYLNKTKTTIESGIKKTSDKWEESEDKRAEVLADMSTYAKKAKTGAGNYVEQASNAYKENRAKRKKENEELRVKLEEIRANEKIRKDKEFAERQARIKQEKIEAELKFQKDKAEALSGGGKIAEFYANKTNSVIYNIGKWWSDLPSKDKPDLSKKYHQQHQGANTSSGAGFAVSMINTATTGYINGSLSIMNDDASKLLISRPLSEIPAKEISILRIFETLSVAQIISYTVYDQIKRSIIYNDGNCNWSSTEQLSKYSVQSKESFSEFLRNSLLGRGNAIEHALETINNILKKGTDDLVISFLEQALTSGNRWATTNEILSSYFSQDEGLFLGDINSSSSPISVRLNHEGSLITIAPPGAGKTQTQVFPNLVSYPNPCVVLDVKGECWNTTSKIRAEKFGKVIKFAPLDEDNSAKYNPLTLVRSNEKYLWKDAQFLADMIIIPQSKNDPSWEQRGKDLVTCAIAYLVREGDPKKANMSGVLDLVTSTDKMWDLFMRGLQGTEEYPTPSPMRRQGGKFANMSIKQLDGIVSGAMQHLSAWEGYNIEKVTSSSDWVPQDLRKGNKTLYICIPPGDIAAYASILRVIIAQHIRVLTEKEPSRDEKEILFMLDEMPQLGYMKPIESALALGRGYKIKLWMFAQNIGQLKNNYDNYEGLLDICVARCYMNPQEETANRVSNILGTKESILEGTKQPLASPQDLTGGNFKNNIIIFSRDMKPIKLNKAFYYEKGADYFSEKNEILDLSSSLDLSLDD